MKRILKLIARPCRIVHILGMKGFLNWLPDKTYISLVYRCDASMKLDLNHPKLFSEKIQWLKLYDRKEEYKTFVDKVDVRDTVANKVGEKYLIPLIGVYDKVDEIDWEELPNQFVMKCTHDSNSTVICRDKCGFNKEEAFKKLTYKLKKDLFWYGREWAYKGLKRRIIIEEYITEGPNVPDDYKVFCFNGKAKEIKVHRDRFTDKKLQVYDREWNCLKDDFDGYKKFEKECKRPTCLEEMLELSEILAKGTYLARVDWYYVYGKLYFGEITLYEASGFYSGRDREWDLRLGEWLQLPIDD